MAIKNNEHGGRRENQKFKSMLVAQYLLKHTDEDHAAPTSKIITFLDAYGISAEAHSVQRDIRLLNRLLEIDTDPELCVEEWERLNYYIEYDKSKHGYKVVNRPYNFDELKLLAECIHSAKFISEKQSNDLLETVYSLCSKHQAEEIKKKVYLVGRTSGKTQNNRVFRSIQKINDAIKCDCQIEFQYMKYTIQDKANQVSRRNGAKYRYSPFALFINEGNYYMLAADLSGKKLYHFRIDRMKAVDLVCEERTGKDLYKNIDMQNYTHRVFSMFGGEEMHIKMQFDNKLLDTVIEQFGTGSDVFYGYADEKHFFISTKVEVSSQFYSWLCRFGTQVKIISPQDAVDGFTEYLQKITNSYKVDESF
ncbi:MAG: WYL domain-containing protein [Clostridia bacterium]|nr:WYL domain-containing protein [Clostridia bacterium]